MSKLLKTPKKKQRNTDLDRPDGRPEVYDVQDAADGKRYKCAICDSLGHTERRYKGGEIFLTQAQIFVCKEHLPENVVIYDPRSKTCRDKSGQNVWKE